MNKKFGFVQVINVEKYIFVSQHNQSVNPMKNPRGAGYNAMVWK